MLCVLARAPVPGTGKSRLRATVGAATADRLTVAFAEDVLGWAADAGCTLLVAHSGPASLLPQTRPTAVIVPQVDGDLGRRIAAAIDAGFARGASRVVIVGTDCPTLPNDLLQAAFDGLDTSSSTIIPAADGGWIALGVNRPVGTILDGVTWSSADTGNQTVAALAADGRAPRVLDAWFDVDEAADLDHLSTDPTSRHRAPRTMAALAESRAGIG